jgi:VWFA-related protein
VILPVTVKDGNGNPIPGLQKDDFRVFDDHVEQSISVFTAEGVPLSLVVLVDDDLRPDDAAQLVASLHALLVGLGSSDEAVFCHFDVEFYPGKGFTSDQDDLLAELDEVRAKSGPSSAGPVPFVTEPSSHPRGVGEPPVAAPTDLGSRPTKALDDALYAAAQLLRDRDRARRRIVLLLSDGLNGDQFNHHNYEETLSTLLDQSVSVYSIAVGASSARGKFARLLNYALSTGGDIRYARKSRELERFYSEITEQARHEYTLAYVPRGNRESSAYHVIEVRTRQGLEVQTRQGYYSTPRRGSEQ